tara:strand:+ start:3194 stop:3823 length:630 start_codon:yes stop_codon:yes gene_type:complete
MNTDTNTEWSNPLLELLPLTQEEYDALPQDIGGGIRKDSDGILFNADNEYDTFYRLVWHKLWAVQGSCPNHLWRAKCTYFYGYLDQWRKDRAVKDNNTDLQQRIEFLERILDKVHEFWHDITWHKYEPIELNRKLTPIIKPYLESKKPPEPEIELGTLWMHNETEEVYILAYAEGKFLVISINSGMPFADGGDTIMEAFDGCFERFERY